MARVPAPSDSPEKHSPSSLVFQFTDIPKATLRKSLEIIFDELQQHTFRERRITLRQLRYILSLYCGLRDGSKGLSLTKEETERWHAAVRRHADALVKLSEDIKYRYFFLSLVAPGEMVGEGPAAYQEAKEAKAKDLVDRLITIRDRAASPRAGGLGGKMKALAFRILLKQIATRYTTATGKAPRISTNEKGKNTGPYIRLMRAVCDLAGEPHRTNEAIAIAFRRARKYAPTHGWLDPWDIIVPRETK
jgi:hypothetical protein